MKQSLNKIAQTTNLTAHVMHIRENSISFASRYYYIVLDALWILFSLMHIYRTEKLGKNSLVLYTFFLFLHFFYFRSRGVPQLPVDPDPEGRAVPGPVLWSGRPPLPTLRGARRIPGPSHGPRALRAVFPHVQRQAEAGPIRTHPPNAQVRKTVQGLRQDPAQSNTRRHGHHRGL